MNNQDIYYIEAEDYAHHEAGHMVMAVALGGNPSYVEDDKPALFINLDPEFDDECSEGYALVGGLGLNIEHHILVDLAGDVASGIYKGDKTCRCFRRTAAIYVKLHRQGKASEFRSIDGMSVVGHLIALDPDATDEQLIERYQQYCREGVLYPSPEESLAAVHVLADTLIDNNGALSTDEVYDAFPDYDFGVKR